MHEQEHVYHLRSAVYLICGQKDTMVLTKQIFIQAADTIITLGASQRRRKSSVKSGKRSQQPLLR